MSTVDVIDGDPIVLQDRCLCIDCQMWESIGCPMPAKSIPSQSCVNTDCSCVALASQGYCEGCYVATK